MTEQNSFRQQLLAVLDFDGIPERQRVKHVASAGKFSLSTARRMLTVDRDIGKSNGAWLLNLADGLSVNYRWLYNENFERFDPRTMRIHLLKIKHYEQSEVENIISPLLEPIEGEPLHVPLAPGGVGWHTAIVFERHRRLSNDWERDKHLRFLIRIRNDDKKAFRLSAMLRAGQITRQYFFSMM